MDPFARFRRGITEKHIRRLPEELVRGEPYVVTKFERKLSDYKGKDGSDVYNMTAYFRDKNTNCYVYMGSDFNNPTEEIASFNSLIAAKQNPKIAFYGFQGKSKVMDLLKHNEEIDESRMSTCTANETAIKRSSSTSLSSGDNSTQSPSKSPTINSSFEEQT